LKKPGPQGLTVRAGEVRSLLGLSNPEEGDEIVGGRAAQTMPDTEADRGEPDKNAALPDGDDDRGSIDKLINGERDGYTEVSSEIASVLEKAADAATDYASFRAELEKLVIQWKPDKIAECIAVATFKARVLGAAEFDTAG